MNEGTPTVIVLAGPNGAGKTTSARALLVETLHLPTFVNADVIAQGLSGFNPEVMAIEAGRIMLNRLHDLAAQRASFAFETTLSGRAYGPWLRSLKEAAYQIHLVYFWLASDDLAVARVAERVWSGGHHIPENTIRQRYRRSIDNFLTIYRPLATVWSFYDNSGDFPRLIAKGDLSGDCLTLDEQIWHQIQRESI